MYSYTNKKGHKKGVLISAMTFVLAVAALGISYVLLPEQKGEVPVSTNDISVPVIALPDQEEKAIRPYKVEAAIVLDYYDGADGEIPSMTKFEGTYRANQGIDYAFQDEEFDVIAVFGGEVVDVKEDPLFGHSCTIQTEDISVTYQSLKDMKLKVGDQVKQGDAISLASVNIYNKDLGNHLHLVTEKNGVRIDPETLYEKSVAELP